MQEGEAGRNGGTPGALVTIAIPTLGRPQLLRRALESAREQTYGNLEILVLNDGCPGEVASLRAETLDERVKFISHGRRIGFVANWTYAVKAASGDFLCILGDDDYYEREFIARRMHALGKCPDALAVTGAFWLERLGKGDRLMSRRPLRPEAIISGEALAGFALGMNGEWFNGATMYRAETLRSIWDEAAMGGTALDLAVHILLSCQEGARILYVAEPQMTLRIHENQESRANQAWLARCAAGSALNLWHFGTMVGRGRARAVLRRGLGRQVDHHARALWDLGRIPDARRAFIAELSINPWNLTAWLRYGRTYIPWWRAQRGAAQ